MKKIAMLSVCSLLLGGCVSAMTNNHLARQAQTSQQPLLSQEIIDLMGPPKMVSMEVGQTIEGQAQHFYAFNGQVGQKVTIVARSRGTDTGIYFYGDANDYRRGARPLMHVAAIAGPYNTMQDPDGPHSHLILTLPEDADGSYVVVVTPHDASDYTLSVLEGVVPQRELMTLPEPLYSTEGQYMSPFTEDKTVTPWVEKGLQAEVAGNVGQALGSLAALSNSDNMVLSLFGGIAGQAAGREVMLRAMGGWSFIKENSDMSFNTLEDLARYMAFENADHPQYAEVLKATYGIYPELRQVMSQVQMERDTLAQLYPHSFIMTQHTP